MKSPRRYAPMGGSFAPVRVAGFRWNGWQPSAVYAILPKTVRFGVFLQPQRRNHALVACIALLSDLLNDAW